MSRGAGLLTLAVVEMRYPTQVNVSEKVVDPQQLEVGLIDAETIKYYVYTQVSQGAGRVGQAKEGTKQEVINSNPNIISSKQRNYRAFKLSYFDKSAIMPRPPHFC